LTANISETDEDSDRI